MEVWNFYGRAPKIEPAARDKMAFPLPDKPSVAVLPFVSMSDDPKQEFFCDGITEEIITELSKVPNLFLISRESTFTYKGKPVKVGQVSEELGVRYVLEGSVRSSSDRLRITAQLIDALDGHHIWADRHDRNVTDLFALQDEITLKIITALQVKSTSGEMIHVFGKGAKNIDAFIKYLQAVDLWTRVTKEANAQAKSLRPNIILTISYIRLGREEEARAAAVEVLKINPKFSLNRYAKTIALPRPSAKRIIEDLRKAGLK